MTIATIQSEACTSGIGRLTSPVGLLQVAAQLSNTRSNPTPVDPLSPEMRDWVNRIEAAGGVEPSAATLEAAQTFYDAILPILSKFEAINIIAPDSLIAAITPLYRASGHDSWVNNGINAPFTGSDIGLSGLASNDSDFQFLETGVGSGNLMVDTSAGISIYCTASDLVCAFDAGQFDGVSQALTLYFSCGGFDHWDCWDQTGNRLTGLSEDAVGFLSGNRIGNDTAIYYASGPIPFTTIATGSTVPTAAVNPVYDTYFYTLNNTGSGSPTGNAIKTYSFMALHAGLTAAETEDLFDAVQALRIALGGGYI